MVVAALGESGLANYVERQFNLATAAYDYLQQQPGFECAIKPQANILCFRVQGSDEHQLAIRDQLISQGDFYLSTSDFNGKRYLRLTFMNPETTLDTLEQLVSAIEHLPER
jgi:L-2,4-diaminobutyrate decarboxylase